MSGRFTTIFWPRRIPNRGPGVRDGCYYTQLKIENRATGIKRLRRVPLVDGESNSVETITPAAADARRDGLPINLDWHSNNCPEKRPGIGRTSQFKRDVKRVNRRGQNKRGVCSVWIMHSAAACNRSDSHLPCALNVESIRSFCDPPARRAAQQSEEF